MKSKLKKREPRGPYSQEEGEPPNADLAHENKKNP